MTDAALARADLRRDQRVIGTVGSAHFLSHFFQLALPPLFPLLHEELDVDYATLGFLMTLFYAVSGTAQAFAGILVDRLGAKRVLVFGMMTMAGSTALASLAPAYWALIPVAIAAGLGNSVFHPSDLSILSLKVSRHRLGRAFGIHAFLGALGYAAAASSIALLAEAFGWRAAAATVGIGGLIVATLIASSGDLLATPAQGPRTAASGPGVGYLQLIAMPVIVLVFLYFAITTAAGLGIQNFAAAAALQIYGITLGEAAVVVTVYLILMAAGILLGGILADRTARHALTTIGGTIAAGLLMIVASLQGLSLPVLAGVIGVSGFCFGLSGPSRDLMVRGVIPAGSTGKVFGFVYCGGDAGATVAPLLFGFLLDHGLARGVFLASAILLLLSVATLGRFRPARSPAQA